MTVSTNRLSGELDSSIIVEAQNLFYWPRKSFQHSEFQQWHKFAPPVEWTSDDDINLFSTMKSPQSYCSMTNSNKSWLFCANGMSACSFLIDLRHKRNARKDNFSIMTVLPLWANQFMFELLAGKRGRTKVPTAVHPNQEFCDASNWIFRKPKLIAIWKRRAKPRTV